MSDDRRPSPVPRSSPRASTERHPALRPREDEEEARLFAATARAHEEWQQRHRENAPAQSARGQNARGQSVKPGGKAYRRKKRPRSFGSKLRLFAFYVVLPCAIVGGGAWAMTSPAWKVSAVDIEGAQSTPRALVEPIAREMKQQNWLRADLSAIRARFSSLPTVRAAVVAREWSHWPPRLSVQVQERAPWVRLGGGATWWVVDRAGVAFRRATREDESLYPITATAFEAGRVSVGEKVHAATWSSVQRLALALEASEQQNQKWPIRRAYLDRDGMASLRIRGGAHNEMLVRLGSAMWPQKMERAREAMAFFEAAGRRASSLNLVSFSMPTWTPLQPREAPQPSQNMASTAPGNSPASSVEQATSSTPPIAPSIAANNSEVPDASHPDVSPSASPSPST